MQIALAAAASPRHVRDDQKSETNGKDKEAPVVTHRDANGTTTCKESSTVATEDLIPETSALAEADSHKDKRRRRDKVSPKALNSPPLRLKRQDNNKVKPSQKCSSKPSMEPPHPRRFTSQEHQFTKRHQHTVSSNLRNLQRKVFQYRHLPRKRIHDQNDHSTSPGSAAKVRTEKERGQRDLAIFGQRESAKNHAHDAENIENSPQKKNN